MRFQRFWEGHTADDIYITLQDALKFVFQLSQLYQCDTGFKVNQKINITVLLGITTCNRAEYVNLACPMSSCCSQNFCSFQVEQIDFAWISKISAHSLTS